MATEKQIEANRRNAAKSTGPRTAEGKARASRNALKHGFTAEHAATPEELVEMEDRLCSWSGSLARDGDPVKLDLVRLAVKSYHRAERILQADSAEAARRLRNADMLWERERAEATARSTAKLETDAVLANIELESTCAGCQWKIDAFEGLLQSVDKAVWKPENHQLFRKLLRFDASDPKGTIRVPDVWFEKLYRFDQLTRRENMLIAELPWEERHIGAKALELAYERDAETWKRLKTEAFPLDVQYVALGTAEIERLKALRDSLAPAEEIDRLQARSRLLTDDSPATKSRLRYLKEAEKSLTAYLKELREIDKLKLKVAEAALSDPEPDPDPAAPSNFSARNEPDSPPTPSAVKPKHQQTQRPFATIVRNARDQKPPSMRRR